MDPTVQASAVKWWNGSTSRKCKPRLFGRSSFPAMQRNHLDHPRTLPFITMKCSEQIVTPVVHSLAIDTNKTILSCQCLGRSMCVHLLLGFRNARGSPNKTQNEAQGNPVSPQAFVRLFHGPKLGRFWLSWVADRRGRETRILSHYVRVMGRLRGIDPPTPFFEGTGEIPPPPPFFRSNPHPPPPHKGQYCGALIFSFPGGDSLFESQ